MFKRITFKDLILLGVMFFGLCAVSFGQEQEGESITITTYYPAPYGVYQDMQVARNLILQAEPISYDGPQIEWRTSDAGFDRHWNIDQYENRLRFFTERNLDNEEGRERMTITEAGDVGIGTTAPDMRLHVSNPGVNQMMLQNTHSTVGTKNRAALYVGDSGIGGQNNFVIGDGTLVNKDPRMVVNLANGNVGIGTTKPGNRLHVVSPADTSAVIRFGPATGGGGLGLEGGALYVDGVYRGIVTSNFGSFLLLGTAGDHRGGGVKKDMVIAEETGNVGIGTTEPERRLHIISALGGDGVRVQHGDVITDLKASAAGITQGGVGTHTNHPFTL